MGHDEQSTIHDYVRAIGEKEEEAEVCRDCESVVAMMDVRTVSDFKYFVPA